MLIHKRQTDKGKEYTERVQGHERSFETHRSRGYGRLSRRPCALFASLAAATLSRTHHSRYGLHGVVAAFMLSVLSSVFVADS